MSDPRRVAIVLPVWRGLFQSIVPGILAYARSVNWTIRFHLESPITYWNSEALDTLDSWRADGLITTFGHDEYETMLNWRGAFVNMLSGHPAPRNRKVPAVLVDSHQVGVAAARHFLERRFRNLACLRTDGWWSDKRYAGFEQTVREQDATLVQYSLPVQSLRWEDWAPHRGALRDWLLTLPRPCGLFAVSDPMAKEVADLLLEEGIDVPHQIALVGADNDALLCHLATPPLSSVDFDAYRMGHQAAELLDRLMAGDATAREQVSFVPPTGVVARRSSDTMVIDDPEVAEVVRLIADQAGSSLNVQAVLKRTPLSRRSLERRFRKSMGVTPLDYIHHVKVNRARELLATTALSYVEIADRLGFTNTGHLRRVFRKTTGMLPSEYREQHSVLRR